MQNQKQIIARKRFSQNFLCDSNVIDKIVANIYPQNEQHIVEIGPGLGAITKKLLEYSPQQLTAIEIDRNLCEILQQELKATNFNLLNADILSVDLTKLVNDNKKLRIIGNLPYHISTAILFYLLQFENIIYDCYFMLQEEVADRMVAKNNNKKYGRLSVMLQYHYKITKLFRIPPQAFAPQPKVYSSIVKLQPKKEKLLVKNYDLFATIVKQAFQQRRKKLNNSLKNLFNTQDWQNLKIDVNLRAANLTIEDFVYLSNNHS